MTAERFAGRYLAVVHRSPVAAAVEAVVAWTLLRLGKV